MTNVLQFHSKEFKHCETLVKEYEKHAQMFTSIQNIAAKFTIKRIMDELFADIEDAIEAIGIEKFRHIMAIRLMNATLDLLADMECSNNFGRAILEESRLDG